MTGEKGNDGKAETNLSRLIPHLSQLCPFSGKTSPLFWMDWGIIIMQLTGYKITISKLLFGTDIANKESVATKKRLTAP
jgi:hypothetical protein